MAGSYPDVPGYRFAYDLDGTAIAIHPKNGSPAITVPSSSLSGLNNDTVSSSYMPGNSFFAILFPEPRSITGFFITKGGSIHIDNAETSQDTSNGLDGTWDQVTPAMTAFAGAQNQISPRVGIQSIVLNDITSLRLELRTTGGDQHIRSLHLYGLLKPSHTSERLRIVDTTQDSVTYDGLTKTGNDISSQLDLGDIRQRSSATRQFKVTNNSTTKTANNITVTLNAPIDSSPTLVGQYQISTDNIGFANSINIGSLTPGESSQTLYLRLNVANNAQLSTWTARIIAHAVSWS